MAFASKKASCPLRGVQTASQQAALGAWFSSLLGKCSVPGWFVTS